MCVCVCVCFVNRLGESDIGVGVDWDRWILGFGCVDANGIWAKAIQRGIDRYPTRFTFETLGDYPHRKKYFLSC